MSNSPLDLHSADFGIFGDFADFSPVSAPKIPKNHESQTENHSVVDSLHESKFNNPSLRESRSDSWQSTFKNSESTLDSANSTKNAESANKAQQTIEGIAVEVVGFLGDFGCETGYKSAKHSKSPKSPQDAPKSKLQQDTLTKGNGA